MPTFVRRNGKIIPKDQAEALPWHTAVISDTMPALRHMGTGRIVDSKSKFRQDTKASGCVEIGNDPIKSRNPIRLDKRERRDAIRKTIYELRNA